MKTNMKAALSLITFPMLLSGMAGAFEWYMDDGVYMFIGFTMIAGIIWAWIVELSRNK